MALKEPGGREAVRAPFRPLEKRLWLVHWLRSVRPRHLVARRSGSRKATRSRDRRRNSTVPYRQADADRMPLYLSTSLYLS